VESSATFRAFAMALSTAFASFPTLATLFSIWLSSFDLLVDDLGQHRSILAAEFGSVVAKVGRPLLHSTSFFLKRKPLNLRLSI